MAEPLGHLDVGEGPALLAVHGAVTGGRLTFGVVADRWVAATRAAGVPRRIVIVDRPGFEHTPGAGVPIPDQAARLIATAREVDGGRPVDAIGCSFGGLVLLRAVQEAPDAFRSVVVVEAATIDLCPPDMVHADDLARMARQGWEAATDDLRGAFEQTFGAVDAQLMPGLSFLLDRQDPGITLLRDDMAIWLAHLDRHTLGAAVGGTPAIPVLVVTGTRSHQAFRTFGRCAAAALHARLVVLEGAGHAAHLHRGFPGVLAEFIADADGDRRG